MSGFAETGPLAKAKETLRVFVRSRPSVRDLLRSRTGSFDHVHAILPSNAVVGESVDLTVQAWDEYERLHGPFAGAFGLDSTDPEATLPDRLAFSADDDSVLRQKGVEFATPGIQYVTLAHEETGERFVSNPVRVTAEEPDERVYWGDIHLHSRLSDGTGDVEQGLRYGREVMDLDVVAYTDHDTMGFFIPPSLQRRRMHDRFFEQTKQAIEEAHEPGEYVTLMAYEWTKQPNVGGHLNVYFDSVEHARLFDSHDATSDTYEKLWDRLREYNERGPGRALTIPHHPAEAMYPFDFSAVDYDDALAPLVEVYSQWGSSERPASAGNDSPLRMGQGEIDVEGHYAQDAIELGYRIGLTASSDYHGPHPGHSLIHTKPHLPSRDDWRDGLGWSNIWRMWDERSYPGGLQAFLAPELTREAAFDAMQDRRVYGTTQPDRLLVDFRVNGVPIGKRPEREAATQSSGGIHEISVEVAGTAPVERVTVVKNAESWRTWGGADGHDADLDVEHDAGLDVDLDTDRDAGLDVDLDAYTVDLTWQDEPKDTSSDDNYYVRVRQVDGGMAWAGPIWPESDG